MDGVYTVFFGREITNLTAIYRVTIRFWPTLCRSVHVHANLFTLSAFPACCPHTDGSNSELHLMSDVANI
jgi:hypothetical protein